ncbi:MAG TPA: LysM domain-containing protein [Anaeromyxobacteraceae bacterium]|nr:LysM domain-containing protein [Anaeromyxobacteraceae bacterium]
MSPCWKIAALAAALPSLALAQANALDAAKGVSQTQQAGVAREEKLIDPAFSDAPEPAPAKAPSAAPVDLTPAAEQLEGTGGEEALPAPAPARAPGAAPPDSYTVKPGDTLWDLSGRYLDNPWYWPKLWSYNPGIANPHWIYPGNVVRFFPAGEEAPAQVAPVADATAAPAPVDDFTAPKELEDLSRGSIDKIEVLDEEDAVMVVGPYKVAHPKPKGPMVQRNSFVTPRELQEAGNIVAAFEEKMNLSVGDKIYAHFRDPGQVKVGQKVSIYRTEGAILHPLTHELCGYKTVILGSARVTAVAPAKATTLVITYSNEVIERGDLIGPASEQVLKPLFLRPNRTEVAGFIIGVQPSIITGAAEFNVVYLDKGKADGVDIGNTFVVVRSGDPLFAPIDRPMYGATDSMYSAADRLMYETSNRPMDATGLPAEVIGEVIVFDAQERASSAYVRRSLMDVLVGDHVEMHPEGPGAGSGKQGG